MKQKYQYMLIYGFLAVLVAGAIGLWMNPKESISKSERRKLATMPELTVKNILEDDYTEDLESYLLDHFPFRDSFRQLKAFFSYHVLQQKANNEIYVVGDYVGKLEYPLSENSVVRATEKMKTLQETYFSENKVYYSIIPDKNYFLAKQNGYPAMDYKKLEMLMQENLTTMSYIDIFDTLSIEDYYQTDTHWRQECLQETVTKVAEQMDIKQYLSWEYERKKIEDFYGVYHGQSALALPAETISYLTNDVIEQASVWNLEKNETKPIYAEDTQSLDKYDLYLHGAQALQVITSPMAKTDKRLIVFRDSFGSSFVPLLLEAYQEVVLIDMRYISSTLLGDYVDFADADILFLYNTLLLNSSAMLK